jgi:hypothetical protein
VEVRTDVSQNLVELLDRVWCVRNKPPNLPLATNAALSGATAGWTGADSLGSYSTFSDKEG